MSREREREREGGRRNKTYKGGHNGKQEAKKHTHDPDDKIEQIKTHHQRMRKGGRRRRRRSGEARGEGDERGKVKKERKGRMGRRGGGGVVVVVVGVSEGDQRTRGKMRYGEIMGDRRGDGEDRES